MTSGSRTRSVTRWVELRVGWMLVACLSMPVAWAQTPRPAAIAAPSPAPSSLIVTLSDNPNWSALTPAQKSALSPLQREWPSIEPSRRAKWLEIANRFPSLAPAEQQRIRARMAEWANLSPAERGRARQQFQESRQIPATDRQAQWEAYQSLPEQTRKELAQRARPAPRPSNAVDAKQQTTPPAVAVKRNDTPTPRAARSKPVTPTVVQARPGATTTLLTRPATPPMHQQAGLPKIAATPGFVNPSTLLPNRGPQGAAVRSAAASGPAASP